MNKVVFGSIVILLSCSLQVNTVDPQVSSSINVSKENGVFVKQYESIGIDSSCEILEAWVEYAWKNALVNNKITRKKTDLYQLVISIKAIENPKVRNDRYLIDWELQDSTYGYFGSANGVFDLRIRDTMLPSQFHIYLRMKNAMQTPICEVFLKSFD